MANHHKSGIGGKIIRILLEIIVVVAILCFAATKLPKDLSITSIGSDLSQTLLTSDPTAEPTETPINVTDTKVEAIVPEESPVPKTTEDETASTPETADDVDTIIAADDENILTDDEQPVVEDDEQPETIADTDETDISPVVTDEPENEIIALDDETVEDEVLVSTARIASITISAAGDCTLGGDTTNNTYKRFSTAFDNNGAEYFFANVADIFASDDLTIVNLEGTFTDCNTRKDKTFSFKGRPKYATILSTGSVEAVSISNNHSQDYYAQGLADTKKTLDYVGVAYAGLGTSYTTEINGITVGMLSYTEWDDKILSTMTTEIQQLKTECDLVVVSIHWGEEKVTTVSKKQTKLGHAAIDAGADLVLGHHPHVVQGIEEYNGKYIVYSLGNFCFGGNSDPDDKDTFIFQQTFTFESGAISETSVSIIPCSISSDSKTNNYQPTPIEYNKGGKAILKKLIERSKGFEHTVDWQAIVDQLSADN